MTMMTSRRKVKIPRTRETVMFVLASVAFDMSSELACASPAVASGFGTPVTEKEMEVCVAVETMFVVVAKLAVVVVVVSVLVAKVKTVVSTIAGMIVWVVVTVEGVGGGGKLGKEEGNGSPDGKGNPDGKGGNPNCLPDSVTVALPPPSVALAGTDIQVLFAGRPRFSQSSVVQPAVIT